MIDLFKSDLVIQEETDLNAKRAGIVTLSRRRLSRLSKRGVTVDAGSIYTLGRTAVVRRDGTRTTLVLAAALILVTTLVLRTTVLGAVVLTTVLLVVLNLSAVARSHAPGFLPILSSRR